MKLSARRSRVRVLGVLGPAAIAVACGTPPAPRGEGVSLVVLVAVDQARYEYLERFRPLLAGGLARLLDEGTVFTNAFQNHATTETAPGHAALSTGTEPAHSGIVANEWFERDTGRVVLSVGTSAEPSPEYLETTALADWMRAADSRSKVFSASAKDRSAVMLGGHDPDGAYWYDSSTGAWRTASYYDRARRQWLEDYNLSRPLESLFGSEWTPLASQVPREEYGIRDADRGLFAQGFPHPLGGYELEPGPWFYGAIYGTPFIDWYLGQLAQTIVVQEDLGADGNVDLLALSFSALDTVGHAYGPNSPEVLDVVLRLDRVLGELLDLLVDRVGREHLLVALSADHGVPALPELLALEGEPARRLGADDVACVQNAGLALRHRIGGRDWLRSAEGGFYLNERALAGLGVDKADIERAAADLLQQCDAVRRVWTSTELAAGEPVDDPYWERYHNNFFPGRSPDLQVQLWPHYLAYAGTGTTHGSPYDYDAHVPIVFWGAGIPHGSVATRVAAVDVAPTLAALLGVRAPADLDGVERTGLLERASSTDW